MCLRIVSKVALTKSGLWSLTISQKSISNPKQPSCKKKNTALRKAMVKKDVKSKVAAKKWL